MLNTAIAAARLEAATVDAKPLSDEQVSLLDASVLHDFSEVPNGLGLKCERSTAPAHEDRLPLRVARQSATALESALWKTYVERGTHELLTKELVAALAKHLRSVLAPVTIRGLQRRAGVLHACARRSSACRLTLPARLDTSHALALCGRAQRRTRDGRGPARCTHGALARHCGGDGRGCSRATSQPVRRSH
jgi:hypothetical protein